MNRELDITECTLCYTAQTSGATVDVGGSVGKAVVVTDHCNNTLQLRLIRFDVASQLDDVISYIRTHAQMCRNGPMFCTGAKLSGDSLKRIENELNVSIEVLFEFDSSYRSFFYLIENHLLSEWLRPVKKKLEQTCMAKFATFYRHKQLEQGILPEFEKASALDYPYYFLYIGSGMHIGKLYSDGHFENLYGTGSGGKQMQALGMHLTGAKSYDELMALAAEGDQMNVDISTQNMSSEQAGEDDDMYSEYKKYEPVTLFPLGKITAQPQGNYATADIARSILTLEINRMVCAVTNIAPYEGIEHVFVYGGFADNELVRDVMTEVFVRHAILQKHYYNKKTVVRPYFMKHSAFLPCIGNLMKAQHPLPLPSETSGWLPY